MWRFPSDKGFSQDTGFSDQRTGNLSHGGKKDSAGRATPGYQSAPVFDREP